MPFVEDATTDDVQITLAQALVSALSGLLVEGIMERLDPLSQGYCSEH
jgi:hypothetical protein